MSGGPGGCPARAEGLGVRRMAQGTTVRSRTGECPEARSMNGQSKKVTRKTEGRLLDLEQDEAPGQLPGDGTDGRR